MTRNGRPIEDVGLRNKQDFADPRIVYSTEFEEWSAAKAANTDLWRWTNGEYPAWFMSKVVAHYQLENQIAQHSQDAAITLGKKKK